MGAKSSIDDLYKNATATSGSLADLYNNAATNPTGYKGPLNYNANAGYDPTVQWIAGNGDVMGALKNSGADGPTRFGLDGGEDTKARASNAIAQKGTYTRGSVVDESYSAARNDPYDAKLYAQGVNPLQLIDYYRSHPDVNNKAIAYNDVVANPESTVDKLMRQLAIAASVSMITAGVGGYLAAPAAAAGGAGAGAAAGGASGTLAGAGLGSTAAGAIAGGVGGAANSLLTSGGSNGLLKGIALGALGGATGGYLKSAGVGNQLANSTGLNQNVANTLVSSGAKAGLGAVGSAANGGNAGSGATAGALSGLASGVGGAVAGSIFGNGSGTINPSLTNSSNPNMADDGLDYITPTASYMDDGSGANYGFDPSTLGNLTPDEQQYLQQSLGNETSGGYGGDLSSLGAALGGNGQSSSAGSSLGGLLAKLLGGSGGGSGGQGGLLASLLNGGMQYAGGSMNQQAGINAANTLAGHSQFNPYSVSTGMGTTTFGQNGVQNTLSAPYQQLSGNLSTLANNSAGQLQNTQQNAQNYYNMLQKSQQQGNNRYYQNNLDDQFGKGILSSTAGQYQSQAALANISQQQLQDQLQAQQMANNQASTSLSGLATGLNGLSGLNSQQLNQAQLGGSLGSQQSNANFHAYAPLYDASKGSVGGTFLGSLGSNGAVGNGVSSLLQQLLGGGH